MVERPFPAYKGDEPYIFVSDSHADAATFPRARASISSASRRPVRMPGLGHVGRAVDGESRKSLFIPLADHDSKP
jgi:hypothetical protein